MEPHLDGTAVPGVDPQYEEIQRKYAFYRQFESSPTPRRLRLWHVLATFAVGAIAGLIGAWSLQSTTLPSLSTKLSQSLQQQAAARAPVPAAQESAAKGIRAGELPYDGGEPQAPARAAIIDKQPEQPATRGDAKERMPAAPVVSTSKDKPRAESETAAAPKKPVEQARKAAADKPAKSAARKHSSGHSISQKDREIDRIRRQANEEFKKQNESRHTNETLGAATAPRQEHAETVKTAAKADRMRALLARCEGKDSLFQREKCKWQLCGDMWGKNGCPSFQSRPSLF